MATLRCTEAEGWDGIADALDRAMPGDEVVIGAGEYRGWRSLLVKTGVHLRGEDNVYLNCSSGMQLITLMESHGARVSNLKIAIDHIALNDNPITNENFEVQHAGDLIGRKYAIFACLSNDIVFERCILTGSGLNGRLNGIGIYIESSRAEISGCSISNFQFGIFVYSHPRHNSPSKLTATNNRCHDNLSVGINLLDSAGVLKSNKCWRNVYGIYIIHKPNFPNAPPELTATNNHCHDNSQSGIDLQFSTTGLLEDNECWGNAFGISARQNSPNARAELTVINNRCHDNSQSGIILSSLTGVLDGNECWGNSSGIVAQRVSSYPEAPSELTASNNHCHDNSEVGILLLSSTGALESNECWGNEVGIAAQRDPVSPGAPSKLTATNNHCHDNRNYGFSLSSSTGELIGNECWENFIGIFAQDNSLLTATKNRCHDNRDDGFSLYTSTGELIGNECWGNTNGISTHYDLSPRDATTVLTATNNCCHDNRETGILLQTSSGILEGNECWENEYGIIAQHDPYGILAQHDPYYAAAPYAELKATNNRCHDNRKTGILLRSSTGMLEGNECWRNESGIVALRAPQYPETPSELTATNNRCHNNRETNIELTNSVGNLWDNESVGIPSGMHAPMSIYEDKNNGKPFPHPGHWRNLRHENGKTCINLLPPSVPEIEAGQNATPSLDALSGLIRTGGCPHCFHRFWLGDEGDALPFIPTPASLTPPNDSSERIYSVKRRNDKQDEPVEIRRVSPETISNSSQRVQEGSALSRILGCIDDMSAPPSSVYSVAWVSADTAQLDAEFARFAEARVKFRDPIHNLDFSSRPSGDEPFRLWLDEQWLANRRRGLEYWKAMGMIPVGELMPGWKSMIFMLTFLLLTVLWVVANAWPSDYQGSLPPINITEATALLNQSVSIFAQEWSKLSFPWKVVGGFVLSFVLFVFLNRHQPPALRIAPEKFAWAAELVEFPGVKFLLNWLLGHPSEISRKRWLRTQLFGYKLFGLFKFQPDSVIFVFRGVDALSQIEQEELLELARLRHEGQVALLITEMTDLSMLLNTWLDVWLPDNRDGLAKDDSAYIIHNPKYLNIPKSPDIFSDLAIATNDTLAARSDMAKMFRLESIPQGESTTREDEGYMNDLVDDVWGFSDLLPMLIVGSNHYAPMSMERLVSNDPDKIKPRLLEMLHPYAKLLKLENNEFPLGAVKPTEAIAKKAEAIYKRHRPGEASTSWLGCQEYRQRLGNALRDWFLFKKHSHEPARLYLAAQMACGELFHINQAIHSSNKWSKNELKEDGQQRLALHCEAGLFLMRERMSIELLPTILASTRYEPQELRNSWGALTQSIHQELNESPPEVCATRISIVCLQAETAFGDTVIQPLLAELADLINNPFIRSQNDKSIWNAFLSSVRNTLLRLSGVSGGEAQTLLEKRFRQDWGELPETLKNKLRESLKGSYDALIFQAMSEMADEQSLETLCRQLTHRPAFLIANLLVLAIPGALAENVPEVEIASILRTIRKNVPDSQDMEKGARFIGIPCGVKKEVNHAAWRVLNTIHKESWKWKSTKMPDMSNEIEGLALGKHGAVAGSLDQLVELELRAG